MKIISSLNLIPLFMSFSGSAFADSKTFKIDVSAEGYRDYILVELIGKDL